MVCRPPCLKTFPLPSTPDGMNSRPPTQKEFKNYSHFKHGLPVDLPSWRDRAAKCARKSLDCPSEQLTQSLGNPYVMHLARVALTLADHEYSGRSNLEDRLKGESGYPLYANTNRKTGHLNQQLDQNTCWAWKNFAARLSTPYPNYRRTAAFGPAQGIAAT